MRGVRVEDQLGRDAAVAQRGVPLLGLADRAGEVVLAVQDQGRGGDLVDLRERRHRGVPLGLLPRRAAELVAAHQRAVVAGAVHAHQVADDAAGDGGLEPVVVAGQPAGHEAAVAVAGDREPVGVGEALGDERVDRLEEVVGVGDAPRALHAVVERVAVAVAAARVDQQDRPALGGERLVVEVHLVGRGVPRVVRAAVDVEQQRPRALALGVADQPGLDLGAVGDGEGALLADEQVDVGEAGAVVGQHGLGAGREVERDDLAVRRRGGERDHGGGAGDREPRDDAAGAGEDRTVLVPQVRAAAVADREQQPAVGGLDGERAGVRRATGHHVAVEVAGEVDGRTAVERDAQQVRVAERQARVADDQQALAVGAERDRGGDAALEGDGARLRLRVVDVEQVHGGLEGEVAVGADLAGERDRAAVGRPGRLAGVVAVGQLPAVSGGEVDHVELVADRAEQAGAVGLVVDGPRDQRAACRPSVAGRPAALNAIRSPFGLQTGAPAPSGRSVTFSGSPPSAASTCTWPSRRNASRVPSGDQAGAVSLLPEVRRRGVPPAAGTVQSWSTLRSCSRSSVRST